MAVSKISFAGGSKGKNVRADGKGGFLPRGWYVVTNGVVVYGPASHRDCLAHNHAGGAELVAKARA